MKKLMMIKLPTLMVLFVMLLSATMPINTTITILTNNDDDVEKQVSTVNREAKTVYRMSPIDDPIFTAAKFESQILSYEPKKRVGVSDKDYKRGCFILGEVRKDVAKDLFQFNYSDYWNITTAFRRLKEPKAHIELAFQKAIDNNGDAICEYIEAFGEEAVNVLTETIPEVFTPFYESNCNPESKASKKIDPMAYAKQNGLDVALVQLVAQIGEDDQRYRKVTGPIKWEKQTPLDKHNLVLIDSLYQKHQSYIGRTLVGQKYESTMWAVIQHSNIESMEKYLPVMAKAVEKEEVSDGTLKLLLDRIHCIKYKYQFFGSQYGGSCELADEDKRKAIEKKYKLGS